MWFSFHEHAREAKFFSQIRLYKNSSAFKFIDWYITIEIQTYDIFANEKLKSMLSRAESSDFLRSALRSLKERKTERRKSLNWALMLS